MNVCCLWQKISGETSMVVDIPNLSTVQDFPYWSQKVPNFVCILSHSSAVSLAMIATVAVTSGQDLLSSPAQQQTEENWLCFGLTKQRKLVGLMQN